MKFICRVLYEMIGRHLPKSYSFVNIGQKQIRYFLIKGFCDSVGRGVNVERNATIASSTKIGDKSGIGVNAMIDTGVTIGKNVMMAPDCHIYTHFHKSDRLDIPMCEQGETEEKPVIIGDDVWIGDRVIIMPGVSIGSGSIIGAGAVVTKSVPEFAVVAGVPAAVVRYRK